MLITGALPWVVAIIIFAHIIKTLYKKWAWVFNVPCAAAHSWSLQFCDGIGNVTLRWPRTRRPTSDGRVILLRGIRKWPSQNGNFEPKPASASE